MNRSQSISSTVVPVATLVLGIAIGWRLGPDPAFRSGLNPDRQGSVTLAESEADEPWADPESGSPAEIGWPTVDAGEVSEQAASRSGEESIQYFPEAVAEDEAGGRVRFVSPLIAGPDAAGAAEPFDEEVWRAELTGLTDEQADELVAIRKRLGKVAAQTLGVEAESFPSLPSEPSPAIAEGAEPRILALPDDDSIRPAIELAAGQSSPANEVLEESVAVEVADAGKAAVAEGRNEIAIGASVDPAVTEFRDAVEAALRLNLRNQKTPGFRRSEVVVVGVGDSPVRQGRSAGPDAELSERQHVDERVVEGSGVAWLTRIDVRPGESMLTGNPLDVALEGEGWLMVEHGDRRCVTRCGLLCWTDDGRLGLRTSLGALPLVPAVRAGEAAGRLLIAEDGAVTIAVPSEGDGESSQTVGRIVLFAFPNESALERLPGGLLVETAESGQAFEFAGAVVKQGYLEESAADPNRDHAAAEELLQFADQLQSHR